MRFYPSSQPPGNRYESYCVPGPGASSGTSPQALPPPASPSLPRSCLPFPSCFTGWFPADLTGPGGYRQLPNLRSCACGSGYRHASQLHLPNSGPSAGSFVPTIFSATLTFPPGSSKALEQCPPLCKKDPPLWFSVYLSLYFFSKLFWARMSIRIETCLSWSHPQCLVPEGACAGGKHLSNEWMNERWIQEMDETTLCPESASRKSRKKVARTQ